MAAPSPRIVIVGGGFGGLSAAKALAGKPVSVALVDRTNHHTFQPLLYQVATTVLSPGQIAAPLRHILRRARNVAVVLGEATGFDLAARRVELAEGHLGYDFLIVAAGARHSYFGHPDWERDAPGLKTLDDALEIRRRALTAFEDAERRALAGESVPAPILAVVGGGPTGVELAGAFADIARQAMRGNFRAIDPANARVLLLEGGPRVLPTFPQRLSASAQRQLEALGVEVRLDSMVTDLGPHRLRIGEREVVDADVIVWASGVAASPLGRALGGEVDRAGRVRVEPDLSIPGHPEVFAIGDLALYLGSDGKPMPGVAQVAIQQGRLASRNVLATLAGRPRGAFRYRDYGTMATIGRRRAIADLRGMKLTGLIAWLAWLFVHLMSLVGFHNRLAVFREWMWAYFTRDRSARLITGGRRREVS
jgi:NADH:quinone reductase (non-electrogenic)